MGCVVMRCALIALLLVAGSYIHFPVTAYSDQDPCRDQNRKITALRDRIASLERTLEAERFDKIDTNYKYIIATLALNKSEAVVASLKVENARLKAAPVPTATKAVSVPPVLMKDASRASPAKSIPPSSKPPKHKHVTALKKKKPKPAMAQAHAWTVVKKFWP
jgi:hypothetical protein